MGTTLNFGWNMGEWLRLAENPQYYLKCCKARRSLLLLTSRMSHAHFRLVVLPTFYDLGRPWTTILDFVLQNTYLSKREMWINIDSHCQRQKQPHLYARSDRLSHQRHCSIAPFPCDSTAFLFHFFCIITYLSLNFTSFWNRKSLPSCERKSHSLSSWSFYSLKIQIRKNL